jgi:hypothetical protein
MPVRKIPKNHLFVTGGFSSRKNSTMAGFESPLEKDYMLLLEFDNRVASFEEQPLTIPVPGIHKGYTPDLLVRFHSHQITGDCRPPALVEVKHSDDLEKNKDKYAKKFERARNFVDERGWEFEIVTEKEIRIPRLRNLKFLREYRNISPSLGECSRILKTVIRMGNTASVQDLLEELCPDQEQRLRLLPVIWHMVVIQHLVLDLDSEFSNTTIICAQEY